MVGSSAAINQPVPRLLYDEHMHPVRRAYMAESKIIDG